MVPQVLVVESYPDLRAGIVAALRRYSYECDAVATPAAAMLKLREHNYAYVVIDVDTSGYSDDFVAGLDPNANVILISDDAADEAQVHRTTLRKPFSRDELMERMRALPAA